MIGGLLVMIAVVGHVLLQNCANRRLGALPAAEA